MGGIDIRCWFELLEQRVLCSATSSALLTPPLTIDPSVPNVVLPSPLTGTQLPQSSTTVIQNTGASVGGTGPFAVGPDGTIWSTYGTSLVRTDSSGNSSVFQYPNGYSIYGLTVDSNGNAWAIVNSTTSNSAMPGMIARIDTSGNFTTFTIPADQTAPDSPGGPAYVPISIVAGADGNIYVQLINGAQGNKLTQVAPDGTMNSFVLPSVNENLGLVATPDGAIWFCGSEGTGLPDYIGRFTTDGGVQQFVFPIQQGYEPPGPLRPNVQPGFSGLTPGANGSLWFANELGGLVGNITPQGTITEYQTGLADQYEISQMTIAMAQDGSLWMSDAGALVNMNVQGATPTFTTAANITGGTLVTAPDGDIYMGEGNGPIGKLEFNVAPPPPPVTVDPVPVNVVLPAPITATKLPGSSATTVRYSGGWTSGSSLGDDKIAVDPEGTIWSTNGDSQLIRTAPDGTSTTFVDPNGNYSIYGITVDGEGNAWITENSSSPIAQPVGVIARVDANGNFTDFTIPQDGTGSDTAGPSAYVPISIVTGANGDVYFDLSDINTDNKLIQVAPDGTMTFFNLPDGSQRSALVAASDGAIWFAGSEGTGLSDYLGRFNPGDGSVQQFVFPIQQGYEPPGPVRPASQPGFSGLTAGADGSIWFANEFGGLVGNITAQGNITEYQTGLAGNFGISQMYIAMGPDGSIWMSLYDGGLANLNVQSGTPIVTTLNVAGGAIASGPNGQIYFNSGNPNGTLSYVVGQIDPSTAPTPVPPPVEPVSPPVTPAPGGGVIYHGPAGIPQVASADVAAVAPPAAIASVFSHAPAIASHVDADPFSVLPIDSNSLLN